MTRRLVLLDSHAPPEEVRCDRCKNGDVTKRDRGAREIVMCWKWGRVMPASWGCADFEPKEPSE